MLRTVVVFVSLSLFSVANVLPQATTATGSEWIAYWNANYINSDATTWGWPFTVYGVYEDGYVAPIEFVVGDREPVKSRVVPIGAALNILLAVLLGWVADKSTLVFREWRRDRQEKALACTVAEHST